MVTLAGIDLAWLSHRNATAIAWGELSGETLRLTDVAEQLFGVEAIAERLAATPALSGVAIDGPLIINNPTGARACEKELGREYGARRASCHPSNLALYPNADSVALANGLRRSGLRDLDRASGKWLLECYPHPAIIEIFDLPQRHLYKKGRVTDRIEGQARLAQMMLTLARSPVLTLQIDQPWTRYFDEAHIRNLRGRALKHNEDILDAIICLYIAGLFQIGIKDKVFGDSTEGYIYVPQQVCI